MGSRGPKDVQLFINDDQIIELLKHTILNDKDKDVRDACAKFIYGAKKICSKISVLEAAYKELLNDKRASIALDIAADLFNDDKNVLSGKGSNNEAIAKKVEAKKNKAKKKQSASRKNNMRAMIAKARKEAAKQGGGGKIEIASSASTKGKQQMSSSDSDDSNDNVNDKRTKQKQIKSVKKKKYQISDDDDSDSVNDDDDDKSENDCESSEDSEDERLKREREREKKRKERQQERQRKKMEKEKELKRKKKEIQMAKEKRRRRSKQKYSSDSDNDSSTATDSDSESSNDSDYKKRKRGGKQRKHLNESKTDRVDVTKSSAKTKTSSLGELQNLRKKVDAMSQNVQTLQNGMKHMDQQITSVAKNSQTKSGMSSKSEDKIMRILATLQKDVKIMKNDIAYIKACWEDAESVPSD